MTLSFDQRIVRDLERLQKRVAYLESVDVAMGRSSGWVSSAWQKDPLRLGYSGDQTEQVSDLNASAGTNTLTGTAVPAGEIWTVQAVAGVDATTACTTIRLVATINSVACVLLDDATPAANIWTTWTGAIVLSAGDTISAVLTGVTLNDDIYLRYHAVRVDIDQ